MKNEDMIRLFYPYSGLDWLNYEIGNNIISYHHIKKKCDGGKRTLDNGALLIPLSHQYLHLIERIDIEKYNQISKYLKEINIQRKEPYYYQREDIEEMLQDFEYEHKWEKGRNGDILIKSKYLKRF